MTAETKIELGAAQPPVKKKRGPGRPVKSKAQRIRELSNAGFTPKQIAAKTGATVQQIYVVRHVEKKRKQKELASKARVVGKSPALSAPYTRESLAFAPAPVKIEGTQIPYAPISLLPPKPTFWQRVKAVFFPQ